jgi:hypothetical protein
LFLSILGEETIAFLASSLNNSQPPGKRKHPGDTGPWSRETIIVIIVAILDMLRSGTADLRSYTRSSTRPGFSRNRWDLFVKHLQYDAPTLFRLVNEAFMMAIVASGVASLDETMWAWLGEHAGVISIPRKPHGTGFKVITGSVSFTQTGRPFLLFFVPDIGQPSATAAVSLDAMCAIMVKTGVEGLTCDAWFAALGWLENHLSFGVTMALTDNRSQGLRRPFSHDLRRHEYRVYARRDLLVSVWWDAELHVVASTQFRVTEETVPLPSDNSARSLYSTPSLLALANLGPRLSAEDHAIITQLSTDGLKSLCEALGESKCT